MIPRDRKRAVRPGGEANLRRKTLRVMRLLEKTLGVPRQPSHLASPLDMLVATILSQNTNDKNSHRAYLSLRKRFPTWEQVATAPLKRLKLAIRIGGMANQKAPRIKRVLNMVSNRYGGFDLSALRTKGNDEVISELTELDGVGVKTAACVLLFSLGRDVFPVDTHVHRICTRLGLVPGTGGPEKTFSLMRSLVPKGKGYSFHTNLIRFGRSVCRSTTPSCGICPLIEDCLFPSRYSCHPKAKGSRADHQFMLLDNIA